MAGVSRWPMMWAHLAAAMTGALLISVIETWASGS
jgi:hypothetical protein